MINKKMNQSVYLQGGVAHDFNNILQIILGHAELIKYKYCRHIEHDYFDTIENAGLKGKNLVQQLLQFSKKEFYTPIEINVSDAVRTNEMLLSHAVQANIQFDLDLDDYLPNVMLDQTQFSQLLMNLVINARTAIGDKNGRILVKTFMPEKKHDNYFVNPARVENADFVAISVSDTGSGIPDAIVDKIFEPFFTTKGEATGTGMGLAAVYGIIKHHGGDIKVSKSVDWSTMFTIYLPVVKDENMVHNVELSADHYGVAATFSQPWNILVAEDDKMVQKLTVSTLEQMGGVVFAADNGKDAVDLFVANRDVIDILVFDIVMPKLNGVEAYKIIRAYNPNTPVVFVTGYSDNKLSELANEDPSLYLCLRKPCKKIELYTAVANLLENKNV
jgi:CheY-like chemotaxis protein